MRLDHARRYTQHRQNTTQTTQCDRGVTSEQLTASLNSLDSKHTKQWAHRQHGQVTYYLDPQLTHIWISIYGGTNPLGMFPLFLKKTAKVLITAAQICTVQVALRGYSQGLLQIKVWLWGSRRHTMRLVSHAVSFQYWFTKKYFWIIFT